MLPDLGNLKWTITVTDTFNVFSRPWTPEAVCAAQIALPLPPGANTAWHGNWLHRLWLGPFKHLLIATRDSLPRWWQCIEICKLKNNMRTLSNADATKVESNVERQRSRNKAVDQRERERDRQREKERETEKEEVRERDRQREREGESETNRKWEKTTGNQKKIQRVTQCKESFSKRKQRKVETETVWSGSALWRTTCLCLSGKTKEILWHCWGQKERKRHHQLCRHNGCCGKDAERYILSLKAIINITFTSDRWLLPSNHAISRFEEIFSDKPWCWNRDFKGQQPLTREVNHSIRPASK